VALKPGVVMTNYTSKTLNRTFDEIVFSEGLSVTETAAPVPGKAKKARAPKPRKNHGAMTANPTFPAATPEAPALPETPGIFAGKVLETVDAGGYTYINLEQDGKTGWVALPETKVSVGQQVEVQPGMKMGSFTSKSLNRTFEGIVFSGGLVDKKASPTAAPAAGANSALPPGHPPTGSVPQAK
jgi:hypothetical protein